MTLTFRLGCLILAALCFLLEAFGSKSLGINKTALAWFFILLALISLSR